MIDQAMLKNAAFVLAVIAVTALIQSKLAIPVVGQYLPGGGEL